jgi:hypothetical protein
MAQDRQHLQFDEFVSNATTIFDEIEARGEELLVARDGKLFSVRPAPRRHARKHHGLTPQDSLLDIIGIGESQGATDTSARKHAYLADAYADRHEPDPS